LRDDALFDEHVPVFEVYDQATNTWWRLWADGHGEGFPPGVTIFNRLPQRIAAERERFAEKVRQCADDLVTRRER
jgi:hypothetical protein